MSGKRHFVQQNAVGFEIKRRNIGVDPSREYQDPKVYQELQDYALNQPTARPGTNFYEWTEPEIKEFLDRRGEDSHDCPDFASLVQRATECEAATGPATRNTGAANKADEEDADPLDAFMAEIHQEMATSTAAAPKPKADLQEEEDHVADFLEARKANPSAAMLAAAAVGGEGYNSDDDVYATAKAMDGGVDMQYDSDDNPIVTADRRKIEPLAALDHNAIQYEEFNKDFYEEAPEVAAMTHEEVAAVRRQLGVRVSGFDPPRPASSFKQCGFDDLLLGAISRAGYTQPTAIQAQALPAALSGRDVLGIAKTGSGKTAAFVLPLLVHIMDQPELEKGTGPIGVIVAPTRELAQQIHKETRKFSKPYNLRVAALFGGLSKYEQFKELKAGAEVVVCTPGRLIDLIKMKGCSLMRCTYLVFDEADRMFDMGFEPQVRSIIGQVRPDRQTLLFSATMPRKVERLVSDALLSPIRITVGQVGAANEDITQVVEVLSDEAAKFRWLAVKISGMIDQGDVVVFANRKAKVDELTQKLQEAGIRAAAIHGDMDQHSRMAVLNAFKSGVHHVLVATDVAARGLDIRSIKSVVNFDSSGEIETHVHRVGRTGRAGEKDGVAYTLLTHSDARFAGDLVQSLTLSNQVVPKELHDLAMKNERFKKGAHRGKGKKGGRIRQVGGAGLGYGSAGQPAGGAGGAPSPKVPGFSRGGDTEAKMGFTAANAQEAFTVDSSDREATGHQTSTSNGSTFQPPSAVRPPAPAGFVAPSAGTSSYSAAVPAAAAAPPVNTSYPGGGGGGEGGNFRSGLRSLYAGQFRSSFVSSGRTGGDVDAKPHIVAPKIQPVTRPLPPPPKPVTEAPLYTHILPARPTQPVVTDAVAKARAAAAAIAARLAATNPATAAAFPPGHPAAQQQQQQQQQATQQPSSRWDSR